jgi:hypothetical protein
MPPTKKTARKAAERTTKKSASRSGLRKLSASHKRALAEGRTMSATVNRYLAAVNTPKRRGRKVSEATLTQRLAVARERVKTTRGVDKVLAAQEVRDLQAKLAQATTTSAVDVKSLEAAFVGVAKKFAENRGVGYGAWSDAGVSAEVLKRAGIARTRA